MTRLENCDQHRQEAERLRALVANATTPAMRARLLQQAEKHERIARRVELPELEMA
jgi:hypothetical protein